MISHIVIDQSLIEAPNFPRSQEWWQRRLPSWLDASLDGEGRVIVEPNGWVLDGSFEELSPMERQRELTTAWAYLAGRPHFAVAMSAPDAPDEGVEMT